MSNISAAEYIERTARSVRQWSREQESKVVVAIAIYVVAYGAWQVFHWGGSLLRPAIGDAAFWPITLTGAFLAWWIARRGDLSFGVRRGWLLIGAGIVAYLLGDIAQFVNEAIRHAPSEPSLADVGSLLFYPLMFAGVLQFVGVTQLRAARTRLVLDGAALLSASASIVWFIVLSHQQSSLREDGLQIAVAIAYPVGDLALIFAVTVLAFTRSRAFQGRVAYLFSASLVLFIIADLVYGQVTVAKTYSGGSPLETLWFVALALIAITASEYSRTSRRPTEPDRVRDAIPDSNFLAYSSIGITFGLAAASINTTRLREFGAVLLAGLALGVVLFRLEWASAEKRRQTRYFQALVERVADYVVVVDADFVPRYASPPLLKRIGLAAASVLDEHALLRFVEADDLPLLRSSLEKAASSPGSEIRAQLRVHTAPGDEMTVVSVTTNLLDDPAVKGLVLVLHDVTDNIRLESELRDLALHDALTGLPNRTLIRDRLDQMLSGALRYTSRVAALFIDLDDFKDVNDSLGHAAGDILLQAIATRLDAIVRGRDTVGRVGGDEFVILLEERGEDSTAVLVAQRVLEAITRPVQIDYSPDRMITIAASIGIAYGVDATPDDLLRDADIALYRAKRDGKNRYAIFAAPMHLAAAARLELENDLTGALQRGEFFVLYQPIVDLASLEPRGVEALLRWRHPSRGILGPDDFIPLLEERGLIVEVGLWVLREACEQCVAWVREGRHLVVSVNVSAVQLIVDHFADSVSDVLRTIGLDPSKLIIEITESVTMRDPARISGVLRQLRVQGVRIAMDDFGTGYSSLTGLREFEIDILKIDRSFVSGMNAQGTTKELARTIIHLGSELRLSTVAEGIETEEQLKSLREAGCNRGQGYWIAHPMPATMIPNFADTWTHARRIV